MTINEPKLVLEFLGNDLEAGHSTTQTLTECDIVRQAITFKQQRFNGLKSSSDTVSLKLRRKCSAVEDIISTEGDIKAVLKDGDTPLFTGFISTNFSWGVTDHGDQALNITLESMGTRLFNKDFIETGKHFFDCPAATAIYGIVHPLGITIREGDERKLLQSVQKDVDASTSCRELIDQLFYECNAVYWFNEKGEICIQKIDADTEDAPVYDSAKLRMKDRKVVNLSKKIRTYKGARVAYDELSSTGDYLIYRNTTNASATRICNLELPAGSYFDGAEIYTAEEWAAATADEFREPTLISAVNAASESAIVGSGQIVNITNLTQNVLKDAEITFSAEAVGGPYFKILAHNTAITTKTIWRMDLSADVTFVKSHGIIRTQIDGATDGKSMLEEELKWIHDRDNASKHANLLAQYHKNASSTYTFYCNEAIPLGSVIKLNDDVYSGLEVYVLVTARQYSDKEETYTYTAVGISTFDLTESAYHGTTEPAKQSGAQGPAGEPGASSEVQYAIGTSLTDPPGDAMMWGGADMLWNSDTMFWNTGTWEDDVPEQERGMYIWMRVRIGDGPWQYTRLTGSTSWDSTFLGAVTSLPTQTPDGLNLIPGDYFVAATTFGTKPYNEGFAYVYNGSTWDIMDLEDPDNAPKALQCLGGILATGANVTNATYSLWGWFQNLVAQNAVIDQLVAEIAILKQLIVTGDIDNDAFSTAKATSPTSLATLVSGLEYYYDKNGTLQGTCQQISIATVQSLLPVGISYSFSGSVKIGGTTYTASDASPIQFNLNGSSLKILQNETLLAQYQSKSNDGYYPRTGYWILRQTSYNYKIENNSLALTFSDGKAYVHDLIPKGLSDKIGDSSTPFNHGYFNGLTIGTAGSLDYTVSHLGTQSFSLSSSTPSKTGTIPDTSFRYVYILTQDATLQIPYCFTRVHSGIGFNQRVPVFANGGMTYIQVNLNYSNGTISVSCSNFISNTDTYAIAFEFTK